MHKGREEDPVVGHGGGAHTSLLSHSNRIFTVAYELGKQPSPEHAGCRKATGGLWVGRMARK